METTLSGLPGANVLSPVGMVSRNESARAPTHPPPGQEKTAVDWDQPPKPSHAPRYAVAYQMVRDWSLLMVRLNGLKTKHFSSQYFFTQTGCEICFSLNTNRCSKFRLQTKLAKKNPLPTNFSSASNSL